MAAAIVISFAIVDSFVRDFIGLTLNPLCGMPQIFRVNDTHEMQ